MHSSAEPGEGSSKKVVIAIGIVGLIGIITLSLAAAAFVNVNKRFNELNDKLAAIIEHGLAKTTIAASTNTTKVVPTATPTPTTSTTTTTTTPDKVTVA
jgi:flagellar basal body-associated protein FliL